MQAKHVYQYNNAEGRFCTTISSKTTGPILQVVVWNCSGYPEVIA